VTRDDRALYFSEEAEYENEELSMKKYLILFALILIQGCSSGGGDSAPQVAIPLDTSEIRKYQQGDTITALVTFRDPVSGNTASGDVTVTVGDIVQNPYGVDCRAVVYAGTLSGPGGTEAFSIRVLFYQDASNSLYDCGEFNNDLGRYAFLTDTATTPDGLFLSSKSPVQIGNITTGVIFFDDGTWEDCTSTVVAIENVSVPLGLYEAYKISESCSYSDGRTSVSTAWNVPDIFDLKDTGVTDGLESDIAVKSYNFN
jgi:hypothetical protein